MCGINRREFVTGAGEEFPSPWVVAESGRAVRWRRDFPPRIYATAL